MNKDAVLQALGEARQLLARPDNDFGWSGWSDAEAALAEVDAVIATVRRGAIDETTSLGVLFAPTGPIQEVSVKSGWSDAFLELANRMDAARRAEPR